MTTATVDGLMVSIAGEVLVVYQSGSKDQNVVEAKSKLCRLSCREEEWRCLTVLGCKANG